MKFKIVPEVLASFPDTKIGVILVTGVNNEFESSEILSLLKKQQEIVLGKLNKESLAKHAHIVDWQEAYKKFGAKPKDYLSSIENLITRILKNQEVKSVNKLVDLYNIISLKYLIPAGGEDLDKISGDIELAIAGDNEIPVRLLGEKEEKSPKKGEVFYKDGAGAICRRWNWKEADKTKLTKETKNAFLVFEGLANTDLNLLKAAIYELASYIEKYCGGNISFAFLDKNNSEILIKSNEKFQELNTKKEDITLFEDVYLKQSKKIENKPEQVGHNELTEHEIRLEKVKKLKALGIEPWPAVKEVTGNSKQIKDEFDPEKSEAGHEKKYSVAGRIMTKRLHGKTAFVDLQDGHGKIQVYIRQDVIGDKNFENFEHLVDIGDILWVHGTSFKTKMGEITIKADEITLESKCLYPLPEKFHGLTDIETKYRQRYLDLMTNQETKDRFIKRSAIISSIRTYLNDHGYIEVETPMLHPIAGGAAAKPFVTHHNALSDNFYLRIAPELYLKRLIVGGFERVYEINRNFRNEGVSTRHNPEFTMLEFYTANKDYHYAMDFVQDIIRSASLKANGTATVQYGDHVIDFSKDFERISAKNALIKYANLKEDDLSESNIDKTLQDHKVKLKNKNITLSEKVFLLFEELVESKLIQPTFIIDFPIEISPLAKRSAQDPNIAARYELFIAGMEVANSFNELNDPFDQSDRFKDQLKAKESGDEEAHEYDADFIRALEYGLPPTVGVGIGIDRLVMLLTNTTSIKEVILFPTLKKLV